MGLVVHATYKGAPTALSSFEVGPFSDPWKARVVADATVHVKVGKAGVKESGSIAFSSVAEDGDTVTIDDGESAAVVYTFGDGTGGTVDKGATAGDSAQNLKAAIEASIAGGDLNVSVSGATDTLTIVNNNYVGGSITKSDVDDDYEVTDFSGGEAGPVPSTSDYPQLVDQIEVWDVPAGHVIAVRAATTANVWVSDIA